jgi:hypothetical protein
VNWSITSWATKEERMNWICPACRQDNADDVLRCSCGHEAQDISGYERKEIQSNIDGNAPLQSINYCPECNSQNIEKYNSNKRGKILLLLAAVSFALSFVINDGGYILYLSVPFLFVGLKMLFKNKNYIICKDCLFSNYK